MLTRSGSLAFTTILAIVPLMVVFMSILSLSSYSKVFIAKIQDFIFSNFLVSSGHVVSHYVQIFVSHVRDLSWYSTIFLMVTAVSMLFSVESSLNAIWEVDAPRFWIRAVFYYMFILICVPVALLLSFSLTLLLSDRLHDVMPHLFHQESLMFFLPILVSFVAYFMIYKIMPHCHVPYRSAVISAILAAILFECAKTLFTWYIKLFPTYQIIYGAIAAVPIFFIWVYICWVIFLLSAIVGRAFFIWRN